MSAYAGTALTSIRALDYHHIEFHHARPKPSGSATTRREQIIVALLRTLGDAIANIRGGEGYSRRESVLLGFGKEYRDGSYRQLETVLVRMRTEAPHLYGPIRDRYLCCQRVQKLVRRSSGGVWFDVRFRCQTCNGHGVIPLGSFNKCRACSGHGQRAFGQQQQAYLQSETPGKEKESIGEHESIVEYWSDKIRLDQVKAGVTWLAQHFPGEPQLPQAFALVAV